MTHTSGIISSNTIDYFMFFISFIIDFVLKKDDFIDKYINRYM